MQPPQNKAGNGYNLSCDMVIWIWGGPCLWGSKRWTSWRGWRVDMGCARTWRSVVSILRRNRAQMWCSVGPDDQPSQIPWFLPVNRSALDECRIEHIEFHLHKQVHIKPRVVALTCLMAQSGWHHMGLFTSKCVFSCLFTSIKAVRNKLYIFRSQTRGAFGVNSRVATSVSECLPFGGSLPKMESVWEGGLLLLWHFNLHQYKYTVHILYSN